MRHCCDCSSLAAVVAVVVLGSSPVAAQDRQFAETVDLAPGGTLRVDGNKGSMQITSWDRPQVEIRARIELPRRRRQRIR